MLAISISLVTTDNMTLTLWWHVIQGGCLEPSWQAVPTWMLFEWKGMKYNWNQLEPVNASNSTCFWRHVAMTCRVIITNTDKTSDNRYARCQDGKHSSLVTLYYHTNSTIQQTNGYRHQQQRFVLRKSITSCYTWPSNGLIIWERVITIK